ncbi:hypothetical protein LTS10_008011 [Elasticomyces elasticus]|nr:hypothetical protein LTS10_008011 [Elasticomyces elasticus]
MFSIWRVVAAVFGRLYSVQELWFACRYSLPQHNKLDVILADTNAGTVLNLPHGEWLRQKYAKRTGRAGQHSVRFYDGTKTFSRTNEGVFNHPILVISRRKDTPMRIDFVLMRSFGDTPVDVKYQGNRAHFQGYYIPITPTPPHPLFVATHNSDYQTLMLDRAMQMTRMSYVELSEIYTMDINDAEPFDRRSNGTHQTYMLDSESMTRLWGVLERRPSQFRSETQHETGWWQWAAETARRRVRKCRHKLWFQRVELAYMFLFSQISLVMGLAVLTWWIHMKIQNLLSKIGW